MTELAMVLLIAAATGVAGMVIGMLVAPRLVRLGEADDEEPGDGDDPAHD